MVAVDTLARGGVLVEALHKVGTGAFVVVDSEDALHVSPHLSEGLVQTPWWL